nr:unknown [Vitreoscilla sp. C1]
MRRHCPHRFPRFFLLTNWLHEYRIAQPFRLLHASHKTKVVRCVQCLQLGSHLVCACLSCRPCSRHRWLNRDSHSNDRLRFFSMVCPLNPNNGAPCVSLNPPIQNLNLCKTHG